MRLLKEISNYRCKICKKEFKICASLGLHMRKYHSMDLFQYFWNYDKGYLLYTTCFICGKERSLERYRSNRNSICCSKKCDYKYIVQSTIANNGKDYYSKLSRKMRDTIPLGARSPAQIGFWLKKGYSKEEAKKQINLCQRKVSPFCVDHYLAKGMNLEEALIELSTTQKKRTPRALEYWLNLGFSLEESRRCRSEYQDNTSMDSFTRKYGVEDSARDSFLESKGIRVIRICEMIWNFLETKEDKKKYVERVIKETNCENTKNLQNG